MKRRAATPIDHPSDTAKVLPFPSRGPAGRRRQQRRKSAPPAGNVIEIVRLDRAFGHQEEALHQFRTGPAPTAFPIVPDLPDCSDRRSSGIKGKALCHSPRAEGVGVNHINTSKRISYVLTRASKRLTGSFVSADILLFSRMEQAPNRIRELRSLAKMSQEQLGERVGVHKVTISDLERGKVELTLTYMRRLAKALKVGIDELFSEADHPERATAEERELLIAFRESPESARSYILASARAVAGDVGSGRQAA